VDEVRDVWIADGRVIEGPCDPGAVADRTIDAPGDVVMPAGVDVHSHLAGSKVNSARLFRPEEGRAAPVARDGNRRSGTLGSVPTSFVTGYRYAGLGYTFAVDAAIPPLGARMAHRELCDLPAIEKAILILLGNNHFVMDRLRAGETERVKDYVAWALRATQAYGIKVVDPGGVESWKQGRGQLSRLDDPVPAFAVTPRQIVTTIARAVDELGLPHPLHVHGLNLGIPGNAESTLELMSAVDGHRAHLAHIQFHSYGGDPARVGSLRSRVETLAERVNEREGLTVDVGQVMFGATTSMTADGPVGEYLARVTRKKWISHDVELETGCGVVPVEYADTNFVHGLQWTIGLEWFLLVDDPWKLALSTDHPNGGSFLAYPKIIALLMSRNQRDEVLARLPERVRTRTGLGGLDREYSLSEIATITRAAPARILGLRDRGHLGVGAVGDVTIYRPDDDKERMFSLPRWVIKDGKVLIDDTVLGFVPEGRTHTVERGFDGAVVGMVEALFERESSIRFRNFSVGAEEIGVERLQVHGEGG
jgi:formylmethanofuran dehydrogenase subunit A